MSSNTLTRLPKFRVVQSGTSFQGVATAMLESFEWRGKAIRASDSPRTPILYHRGSWLASQGYAPTATDPLPNLPFAPGVAPVLRQYGASAFGRQGYLARLPAAILYNGALKPPLVGDSDFAFADSALQGESALLATRNVFAASFYTGIDSAWFLTHFLPSSTVNPPGPRPVDETTFKGGTLLVLSGIDLSGSFGTITALSAGELASLLAALGNTITKPVSPLVTNVRYVSGTGSSGTYTSILDPFIGGEEYSGTVTGLLAAVGTVVSVPLSNPDDTFTADAHPFPPWAAQTTDPGPPIRVNFFPARSDGGVVNGPQLFSNDASSAFDLDILRRVVPRFQRFRHICYGRYGANFTNTIYKGQMLPLYQALANQAGAYETILRGPYDGDTDLTSIIQQDVRDFFA